MIVSQRLLVLGGESVSFLVQFLGAGGVSGENDSIAKSHRPVFFQREVKCGLLGIEDAAAKGIGGEQTITACVPVGWIARIAGVVEDGN